MKRLPEQVKKTLERLKETYPFYVALARINNKFYLYRRSSKWDKEKKKRKSISEYLGRIEVDGTFVKKEVAEKTPVDLVIKQENRFESDIELDATENTLLKILSMNARADLSFLGKKLLKLKSSVIFYKIRQLEQKYRINYLAEIDAEKLNYIEFLITVKFLSNRPKREELKEVFSQEANVQLAALVKGDFDVLLYVLARNNEELKDVITRLRTTKLAKFDSIWNGLPIAKGFGFVPIRDQFIESLRGQVLEREYAVLKELNQNGAIDFQDIDKKYKFDIGRSDYTYHKLLKSGVLRRTTINMQNIPIKFISILFVWKINSEIFKQNRKSYIQDIIESINSPINKCIFTADMADPDGALRIIPIINDGALEREIEHLLDLNLGIKITTNILTDIIVGSFCYRLFDVSHSLQQTALIRDYGIKAPTLTNYFETGRKKASSTVKSSPFNRSDLDPEIL